MVTVEYKGKKFSFKDKVEYVDMLIGETLAAKETKDAVEMGALAQIYILAQLSLEPKLTFKDLNTPFGNFVFSKLVGLFKEYQESFL